MKFETEKYNKLLVLMKSVS